ncbi:class I SAM-dependent methyltransferase [Noviherbaspirillum sp.]|uniref:class I SAM-dependent methyltransferase n=1 Tax=Noviherbaspirillum sp. TaxID=1926288 RepID=UPI0025E5F523|nr:class I SAM-dependent methyltransferase [Noviherbaspirillum sp.]
MQIPSSPHNLLDQPSAWVTRFAPLIPDGDVLDLACGGGRHTRLLTGLGHALLAVDRDPVALRHTAGLNVTTQQLDLEDAGFAWPFAEERFAGIVVTNYLHRPLFPHIFRSLRPGGMLIYETFAQGNEHFGKPSNPSFLLQPGELLKFVAAEQRCALRVLAFEDGYLENPRPAMVQRICAIRAESAVAPERLRLN